MGLRKAVVQPMIHSLGVVRFESQLFSLSVTTRTFFSHLLRRNLAGGRVLRPRGVNALIWKRLEALGEERVADGAVLVDND